jgi:hypothetical protein
MNENALASFGDNKDTWRTATLVLGFVLLISFAANIGGPSSVHASSTPQNQLAHFQQQANQQLKIGGFTTIEDQPAFIILNEQGERVGSLPMAQHNENSADVSSAEFVD